MYSTIQKIKPFGAAKTGRITLYKKHNTKYETGAKKKDKQVAKLWSADYVKYHRICWFAKRGQM
jgi:hypothetical protein